MWFYGRVTVVAIAAAVVAAIEVSNEEDAVESQEFGGRARGAQTAPQKAVSASDFRSTFEAVGRLLHQPEFLLQLHLQDRASIGGQQEEDGKDASDLGGVNQFQRHQEQRLRTRWRIKHQQVSPLASLRHPKQGPNEGKSVPEPLHRRVRGRLNRTHFKPASKQTLSAQTTPSGLRE